MYRRLDFPCVKHGQNPARKETICMRCRLNSATACIEVVYCDVAVKLSGNIAVYVLFLSAILGKKFPMIKLFWMSHIP